MPKPEHHSVGTSTDHCQKSRTTPSLLIIPRFTCSPPQKRATSSEGKAKKAVRKRKVQNNPRRTKPSVLEMEKSERGEKTMVA
jgi:hypothetical protein